MFSRFSLLIAGVALVIGSLIQPVRLAAQTPGGDAKLLSQTILPDSRDVKFPDVAASSATRQVHVSGNANRNDAYYWAKQDTANSFGDPTRLGEASGQPDFSSTAIAVARDGAIHYAWIDQDDLEINHRWRTRDGAWSGKNTIISGGRDFRVNLELAVTSTGTIFAAWRAPDAPFIYSISTNNGASWSAALPISERTAIGFPSLAAGPNGEMLAAYTQADGDSLQVYVATWTGSGWDRQRVSSGNGDFASPSASISGTGNQYIAFRGVGGGVFFAERQSNGSWPLSRLVNDAEVFDPVTISADEQNNLHIFWISRASGTNDLYHAFRPSGGNFGASALRVPSSGLAVFNARGSNNLDGTTSYGHVVLEAFGGNGLRTQYSLFSAFGAASIGALPAVNDNAAITGNSGKVTVSFTSVRGSPDQLRWRWNAEPSDQNNDSDGWKAFPSSNSMEIAIPSRLVDATTCAPLTLYTQVRNTRLSIIETFPKSDAITMDGGLQATISARTIFEGVPASTGLMAELAFESARTGLPSYTPVPLFYLDIDGAKECSGLVDVSIGSSAATFGQPYGIVSNRFANFVPMPNLTTLTEGPVPVVIRLRDVAGNQTLLNYSFTYDRSPPRLTKDRTKSDADYVQIQSRSDSPLFVNLSFTNLPISDNVSPGAWGLWLSVSRTALTSPLQDASLGWSLMRLGGSGQTFSAGPVSLASGLQSAQITPGAYFVYIRFVDAAGNISDDYVEASVTITETTLARYYLPTVIR